MKKIKYTLSALLAVSAVALAACSSAETQSTSSDAAAPQSAAGAETSAEQALKDLQKAGVLRIGTEGTYAPFSYHKADGGNLTGYDVEVIEAVAHHLGVKPEFSEVKWDGIFAGLEAERYDVIANQVSVTAEREALYDFSAPYAKSSPVVIVKADNTSITKLADVKGKKSAQSVTSNWAELAKKSGAEVVGVDGFTEAIAALRDGRVDLTFNDNLAVLSYFTTTKDDSVKVAFDILDEQSEQAFVTRKGSGLAEVITKALKELEEEGTLAEIGTRYFSTDISQ